jgi:phospholipid/cholesterol/gamma-HCH transport system substrate-binding protein
MSRDFIVGGIFLLALILVGSLTFMLQEYPSGSALTLNIGFEDVSGMKAGDPVRIRGLRSGVVDKIVLDPQRNLAVATIQLGQTLEPREGYEFKILPASALGGTYLRYTPGMGDLVPTDDLRGVAGGDVLGEVGDLLNNTRDSIETGLSSLSSLLKKLDSGQGIFGGLLTSEDAKTQFLNSVENLEALTAGLRAGDGILGSLLLNGSEQQMQFNRVLSRVESEMAAIEAGEGSLGLLLKDPETRENLKKTVEDLSISLDAIANAKGLLGTAIHDEEFAADWTKSMESIRQTTEQLGPEGTGMLARLIHSKKLGDELAVAIESISQISSDINNGPGTLYSLIKDPTLFNDARETLTLLRDSTEDLREQEPVTAFFSILFAPF